jgi:hypothetical protein
MDEGWRKEAESMVFVGALRRKASVLARGLLGEAKLPSEFWGERGDITLRRMKKAQEAREGVLDVDGYEAGVWYRRRTGIRWRFRGRI